MNPPAVKIFLLDLQRRIVAALEHVEGRPFLSDIWEKAADEPLAGMGITRIVEEGNFFERAGVGFSHVTGVQLPPSATQTRPELAGRGFEAMGVSLVLHPRNPFVPAVHMNVRFFLAHPPQGESEVELGDPIWWFGGGMDLTPFYGFDEDAEHFHRSCRSALDPFGAELYPRFKKWCDEYFYLKHRGEMRGIGGIFFDDFDELGFERSFSMLRSVGDHFLDAYLAIAHRRATAAYGERERDWQAYRRGRYVEFNLVFDRGTHFGLQSGGRSESILMSLPPVARWRYAYEPEPASAEAALSDYLQPRDWI